MPLLKTLADAVAINDPQIKSFLRKYAHLIFPRKTPIEIQKDGNKIVIDSRLYWGEDEIRLKGKVFGEFVDIRLPEDVAKHLLIDHGEFEELAVAAAATGGKLIYTTKTKAHVAFGKIILIFSRTVDDYYFIDLDSIKAIDSIDAIKETLEKAKTLANDLYDEVMFGQKAITYIKRRENFSIIVCRDANSASVTIARTDTYPFHTAGEIICRKTLPPGAFDVIANIIPTLDNPIDVAECLTAALL